MYGKNKKLKEDSVKYFSIDIEEDFIQKDVKINNIEIEDGTYGKQLKITVSKGDATAYNWFCSEPEGDKELPNGKILTLNKQIETVEKIVLHIGHRYLGKDFVVPEAKSFDDLINQLISLTKSKWGTTLLNAKFEFNKKGFAGLSKYVPFIEIPGEEYLTISLKDKVSLKNKLNTSETLPDADLLNTENGVSEENSKDLPF